MKAADRAVWLGVIAMAFMGCSRDTETAQPVMDAATAAAAIAAELEKSCAALATAQVAGVTIKSASSKSASSKSADRISRCRVEGVIDGSIGFELLLPDQWNGKFLMGGGGGFMGNLENAAQVSGLMMGRPALERGYATASTDSGHQDSGFVNASWAMGNPQARENFAHRAVHRTAEVSKQIIATYYQGKLTRSYFFGCSRGGGHGMMLAQRYPQDFDGIVAGAPAFDWTNMMVEFLQNQQAVFPDPNAVQQPVITADNRKLLADSLKSCDALDGIADGVLADPRRCKFDPATLPRCAEGPAAGCVTRRQLAAIQAVYADAAIAGQGVYPGQPFGGENDPGGWDVWLTASANSNFPPGTPNLHFAFGQQFARYFVFEDPAWSYAGYDFADWPARTADLAKLLNATDPDLRKFHDRGGKLILWHGWSDSALPATRTIEYYEAAGKLDPGLRSYARLFMLPGVGHCGGGAGPDQVDWIGLLEQWVEKGAAPADISVRRVDSAGATLRERRLCAYPQAPQPVSGGDPNTAGGYRCAD